MDKTFYKKLASEEKECLYNKNSCITIFVLLVRKRENSDIKNCVFSVTRDICEKSYI